MCKTQYNFIIIFLTCLWVDGKKSTTPHGMGNKDRMTCEEFGKFARFNPYAVLDGPWKVFYYWSHHFDKDDYNFIAPTTAELKMFKSLLMPHLNHSLDWSKAKIFLKPPISTLLFEINDRGLYELYPIDPGLPKNEVVVPLKAVLKQKGKYIGMMFCAGKIAFALARKKDMPRAAEVHDVATEIGFRGRGGKSYLYQGNDWMPIGDANEEDVFGPGMKYL